MESKKHLIEMRGDECEQVGFFGLWRIKSSACSERSSRKSNTHTHRERENTQTHPSAAFTTRASHQSFSSKDHLEEEASKSETSGKAP